MIDEAKVTARLVEDEGEVLHCYRDHMGYETIGVGVLIDERRGGGITQEESRYLLRNRIRQREAQLEQRFDWWHVLDDVRQNAILCMSYQLGVNGVANFRKMCAALKVRDYTTAADEALDSNWARYQTPVRAQRMARIIRTGQWE